MTDQYAKHSDISKYAWTLDMITLNLQSSINTRISILPSIHFYKALSN